MKKSKLLKSSDESYEADLKQWKESVKKNKGKPIEDFSEFEQNSKKI